MTMVRRPRFLRARTVIVGNGSAAAPALRGTDADTGVYFTATQILAAINGALQVRVDSNGLTIVPTLGQLTLPDASAAAPSFRFSGATGTGMYRSGTADLGIAVGGIEALKVSVSGSDAAATVGDSGGNALYLTCNDGTGDGSISLVGAGTAIFIPVTLQTLQSEAGRAGLRLPHGSAPSSPVNGDLWTTTAGLFVRINGSTVGPLS